MSESLIHERLTALAGWEYRSGNLERTVEFSGFLDAIAFVAEVAREAERQNHHPDIDIRYTRVTMRLKTHDAGGITERDFRLARSIDDCLA